MAHGSRITSCSRIYASDLKRAHHTAQIYANALGCEVWQEGRVGVCVCVFFGVLCWWFQYQQHLKTSSPWSWTTSPFSTERIRNEEQNLKQIRVTLRIIISSRILGCFHEGGQFLEGCSHLMLAFQCKHLDHLEVYRVKQPKWYVLGPGTLFPILSAPWKITHLLGCRGQSGTSITWAKLGKVRRDGQKLLGVSQNHGNPRVLPQRNKALLGIINHHHPQR